MNLNKQPPFHPPFFGVYPALALFSSNVAYFSFAAILRSLATLLALTAAFWLLTGFCYRDARRAALFTSSFLFATFYYYVPFALLSRHGATPAALSLRPDPVFFSVYLAAVVVLAWFCSRRKLSLNKITNLVNVMGITLLAVVTAHLFMPGSVVWGRFSKMPARQDLATPPHKPESPAPHRSVYYIVLDGYANSGGLRKYFHYDNAWFTQQLSSRGFYVAEHSRSNYPYTVLSLASSLNHQYLNGLVAALGPDKRDFYQAGEEIRHSHVAETLRSHGLDFVALSTGFSITEVKNADVYLTQPWFLNNFENALLATTPLRSLTVMAGLHGQYDLHRERIRFVFEEIGKLANAERPVFVFAHLLSPHPPFVFNEKGQAVNPNRPFALAEGTDGEPFGQDEAAYVAGYRNQLAFLNGMVLTLVDKLLSQSAVDPIIVIQGDHGPGSQFNMGAEGPEGMCLEERFGILNAYHLPGGAADSLYGSISPVNTFRVILNRYFNGNYGLLEDESYLSPWARPYDLQPVGSIIGTPADVRCRVRGD